MAPSAAELFKQATDKRARFADGQTGVSKKRKPGNYCKPALPQKLMAPLYAQVAKNEDFKVLGLWMFFSFFELY